LKDHIHEGTFLKFAKQILPKQSMQSSALIAYSSKLAFMPQ